MDVIDSIKRGEGFRRKPYRCTSGVLTIGYGFTSLTREESDAVLVLKVMRLKEQLQPMIKNLSQTRQDVLLEMGYNLGLDGLYRFEKMWWAIYSRDFDKAAAEMLDSKWAAQVKGRATRLAERMRHG